VTGEQPAPPGGRSGPDERAVGDRGADERLDELQRLWSPWRMAYIRAPDEDRGECPFCVLPARGPAHDRETLIVHRGELAYVILNAYPYNPGHLMSVPFRHTADYDDLTAEELREMNALSQRAVRALRASSAPHGFNIGVNVGQVAGAGIADHVHQHVVPRWGGDTNFMPVIGQTRVLPELLEETYERLVPAFTEA
jgi:ATP adenylyltransferase